MRCFSSMLPQASAAYSGTTVAPRAVPTVPVLQQLQVVGNARDFAEACSRIAPGKLFRSANPLSATKEDVVLLREQLGICELIDLRSALERREDQAGLLLSDAIVRDVKQQGRLHRTHASFKRSTQWISELGGRGAASAMVSPASGADEDSAPHLALSPDSGSSSDWAARSAASSSSSNGNGSAPYEPLVVHHVSLIESVPYITELARRLPPGTKRRLLFSVPSQRRRQAALDHVFKAVNDGGLVMLNQILLESAAPQIRAGLKIMTDAAERERPVLTYCRLGKDRTGIMTSLVLSTCGASEDEIVSDYARTQSHADQIGLGGLEKTSIFQGIDKKHFSSALPETMAAVLSHIRLKFGSVEKYLDHIGFESDDRDRLRKVMLE